MRSSRFAAALILLAALAAVVGVNSVMAVPAAAISYDFVFDVFRATAMRY